MDIKQQLATAHVLHSQAVLAGAPREVIEAMGHWINKLKKQTTAAHADEVGVADSADVGMVTVRKN